MCLCAKSLQSCPTLGDPYGPLAFQPSLSMGFSRREYGNGLPSPPPGKRPNLGIEPVSLKSPALGGGFFTTSASPGLPPPSQFPHLGLWLQVVVEKMLQFKLLRRPQLPVHRGDAPPHSGVHT